MQGTNCKILPLIHFGYFPEIVNTEFFVQSYNDVGSFKNCVEFLFHALTFPLKCYLKVMAYVSFRMFLKETVIVLSQSLSLLCIPKDIQKSCPLNDSNKTFAYINLKSNHNSEENLVFSVFLLFVLCKCFEVTIMIYFKEGYPICVFY